jgi:hypothetical protein
LERKRLGASLLSRIAVVGAAAVVALAVGSPAWANTTININPGNVPTTAAGFGTHECSANAGGGPFSDKDVWVFVLPGEHSTSGDFVSVTATFAGHGSITITAAANPGNFSNGGPETAKAWIVTPAGWTLTGSSAEITGTASFFNLTHTCPASGSPGPSPSPSTSGSPSPSSSSSSSPSPSTSSGGPGGPGGSPGTIPRGGVSTGGGGSQSGGGLFWGLTALVVATGGGVALALAWRRRRNNA